MGLEIIQPLINKFGLILQQGVEVAREVTPSSAQTTAIAGSSSFFILFWWKLNQKNIMEKALQYFCKIFLFLVYLFGVLKYT